MMERIFSEIYEKNLWGDGSPVFYSGRGSNDYNTIAYRDYVSKFIKEKSVKSVVDVGCGDFRVSGLMDWSNTHYTGVDIVGALIAENRKKYGKDNIEFVKGDITKEKMPPADLCLVRQVFQHFSNDDIMMSLDRLGDFGFVLITDGLPICEPKEKNVDKPTDRYNRMSVNSGLYLESEPFGLDLEVVLDYKSRNNLERFRTVFLR